MKTFIQNAYPLFKSLTTLLLIAGMVFCLGSCTDRVGPRKTVGADPVDKYTGYYELMEDDCSTSKNRLEIQPYAPVGESNVGYGLTAKMISISNLGPMTTAEVAAVWNGHQFIIEKQEVFDGKELSLISGELSLNEANELRVFYEISSSKVYHDCIAEYVKH